MLFRKGISGNNDKGFIISKHVLIRQIEMYSFARNELVFFRFTDESGGISKANSFRLADFIFISADGNQKVVVGGLMSEALLRSQME
jgi:hypothetical protein